MTKTQEGKRAETNEIFVLVRRGEYTKTAQHVLEIDIELDLVLLIELLPFSVEVVCFYQYLSGSGGSSDTSVVSLWREGC